MKHFYVMLLIVVPAMVFMSCDQSTGSDRYNALWSPSGDASVTKWTKPTAITEFSQFDRGFAFSTNAIKDSTVTFTFSPQIYQIDNITTASSGSISFVATISSAPDSITLTDNSKVPHQFGIVGGTISTSGDSVKFSVKPFSANVTNTITLSVNPDSCSKLLRFNVAISWNAFTAGTPAAPLPTTKKVEVSIKDIVMRVNNIAVLR